MNFFEHQAVARRSTARMVVLFALAVAGIVVAVDLAVLFLLGGGGNVVGLLVFSTVGTLGVIGLGSLYRMASLRAGGEAVALQMGATEVPESTTDFQLRRLRNVVEEIAIASGVPVPKLYVMEHESAINAFAAGYSPSDAAVAVTRGALERLNRDELQGVIAHEFSHILNGDMRLNIRLMGVLFGIMMLTIIGQRVLLYGRGGRTKEGMAVLVIALVALLVGAIGAFFGRMIKAGVSRQREMLADASAVQFTRQTTGLAGALKKIGGLHDGSRLSDTGKAEEVSHMLFGEGLPLSRLFATHPPLIERIRKLEPSFDQHKLDALSRQWSAAPPDGLREDVAMGLVTQGALPPGLPAPTHEMILTPATVAAQVATPDEGDYLHAGTIDRSMPDALRELALRRDTAIPLLLGLLLDPDPGVASVQRIGIATRLGERTAARATGIREDAALGDMHPMLRLPLASLAFPVLRHRPQAELETLMDTVHAMVHADQRVSLFEYCLATLLESQLRESIDPARQGGPGRAKPGGVKQEFATLLSVVAQAGHRDPADAQRSYLAGLQRILPRDHMPYRPPAEGVVALDGVWAPLDRLNPLAKQVLVEAITATISHDGRITVGEGELLRTLCAVLHCPLPARLEAGRK